MKSAEPVHYITEEEYLEGEKRAEVKHEYYDGQVYPLVRQGFGPIQAMAGASDDHELVALNMAAALLMHLRGKGCRVYKSDMKLRLKLNAKALFYYPDVMVTCDPADADPLFRERPKLIVEVLSEDRKHDLVEKAAAYARIESLEEYAIIDPRKDSPEISLLRAAAGWEPETVRGVDAEFTLTSVGLTLKMADLFAV
jgi:Uma2 family endonuclease